MLRRMQEANPNFHHPQPPQTNTDAHGVRVDLSFTNTFAFFAGEFVFVLVKGWMEGSFWLKDRAIIKLGSR